MDNNIEQTMLWQEVAPISHKNITLNGVVWRDKILIRGAGDDKKFASALQNALGLALPAACRYVVHDNDNTRLSWLSPNEFMLDCPYQTAGQWVAKLHESLNGIHSAVVDVSDYYRVIILGGECRSLLINKACPFNTDELTRGMVVGTHYANATIQLWDMASNYELQVRYSFFPYLWQYLTDGAREYIKD